MIELWIDFAHQSVSSRLCVQALKTFAVDGLQFREIQRNVLQSSVDEYDGAQLTRSHVSFQNSPQSTIPSFTGQNLDIPRPETASGASRSASVRRTFPHRQGNAKHHFIPREILINLSSELDDIQDTEKYSVSALLQAKPVKREQIAEQRLREALDNQSFARSARGRFRRFSGSM